LPLRGAFGTGLRTVDELSALIRGAGLEISDLRDLGWDMRIWLVTRLHDE
jgi:hypothetical protein